MFLKPHGVLLSIEITLKTARNLMKKLFFDISLMRWVKEFNW